MIPSDELRTLRNDVPVLDVIFHIGVPTKRRGRRESFRCPACGGFHTATNPQTNLARCFRCGKNFNPIDLVISELRVSFKEAVWIVKDLHSSCGTLVDSMRNRRKRRGHNCPGQAERRSKVYNTRLATPGR
jgi:DNA-directed RNA polymerase subunit RPC12/RpoP